MYKRQVHGSRRKTRHAYVGGGDGGGVGGAGVGVGVGVVVVVGGGGDGNASGDRTTLPSRALYVL